MSKQISALVGSALVLFGCTLPWPDKPVQRLIFEWSFGLLAAVKKTTEGIGFQATLVATWWTYIERQAVFILCLSAWLIATTPGAKRVPRVVAALAISSAAALLSCIAIIASVIFDEVRLGPVLALVGAGTVAFASWRQRAE